MTTDETRDQSGNTPEQITAEVLRTNWGSYSASERGSMPSEEEDARIVVAALRAAGLLVEGAPTDEQVERALTAYRDHAGCRGDEFREYVCPACGHLYATVEDRKAGVEGVNLYEAGHRHRMAEALAAAGVAPLASLTIPHHTDEHADCKNESEDAESESEGHAATVAGGAPAPGTDREKLIVEAQAAWDAAGRMPQGTMVHETQWKPFAALYNETERLIDALAFLPAPSETKCWCFDLPHGEHHADCEPDPEPTDREKLIAEARRAAESADEPFEYEPQLLLRLADVLAAPAPVDEAKLAEVWDDGFQVGDGVGAYSKRERDRVNPWLRGEGR